MDKQSVLTAEEAKWLKKLQKVLNECPSDRLGFYTTGDPSVNVYDKDKQVEIDGLMDWSDNTDFGTAVNDFEADLGSLNFPSEVHSTSG